MAFLKKARDERLTSLTMLSLGTTPLDLCTRQSHRGGCALVCGSLRAFVACRDCRERNREGKNDVCNEPDGKSRGDLAIISNVSKACLRFMLVAGSYFPFQKILTSVDLTIWLTLGRKKNPNKMFETSCVIELLSFKDITYRHSQLD